MESSKYNIVLFDGHCNLCNGFIQFLIRNDKNDSLRYANLQSEMGKSLSNKFDLNTIELDSIIFISENRAYIKSKAVLNIVKLLRPSWNTINIFNYIPTSFNNFVYDLIAKNRYRLFGKSNKCWIPTDELKSKFLK